MKNTKLKSPTRRILIGAAALAMAGLALAAPADNAQVQPDTRRMSNAAIIERAFDAWAAGTGGPYDLLAEDLVWTITGNSLASKTYNSREAFLSEVIRPFNARMSSGLRPTIRHIYENSETVIVLFDASGTARDGKPYANTYAWFLDLRDGEIVRSTAFYDSIAFNDLWTRISPAAQ
ncbi:nuclear transport factor 2 family protein [Azotobacter sp. CWF10]